jgi:hypothetical protein
MTTMKTYLICSRDAGVLGLYEAASEDGAHDVLARDAGYRDAEHEAEVLSKSVEYLRADLTIAEVDVPAAIEALAHEMVAADRESGDYNLGDGTHDVRLDPDAGDASHWDRLCVVAVADDAGVERGLARAIAATEMHVVRDAYARAWRAAVELDLAAA